MKQTRLVVRGIAAAAVLAAAACTTDPNQCTLVGCDSGVLVVIDGIVSAQVTAEILVDGVVEVQAICATSQGVCQLVLADLTPTQLTVRVTGAAATAEESFSPTYEEQRPNGPDCPPVCLVARVDMVAAV